MAYIHDLTIGQIVYSKNGRDKGYPFIVMSKDGDYLFLADGRQRSIGKPKKKKRIHIQPTKIIDEEICQKIKDGLYLLDADIRKALKLYQANKNK